MKAQMMGLEDIEDKWDCLEEVGSVYCTFCGACYYDQSLTECPYCHDKGNSGNDEESQSSTTECPKCHTTYKNKNGHTCSTCALCGAAYRAGHECYTCIMCGKVHPLDHFCW